MDRETIIKKIKASGSSKIKFAVVDTDGVLRGKYLHKDKFLDSLDSGMGFCDVVFGWDMGDSCYDNASLTGWHTGYPDAKVKIDPETLREIPWENGLPFFLADLSPESKQAAACPRSLLKKIIAECDSLGFKTLFALEYEWYNFKGRPEGQNPGVPSEISPLTPGMFGYSVLRTSLNKAYFNDLFDLLGKFNIPLESIHTETGPGVFEAAIIASPALEAADKATLFKTGVKEIAYLHNVVATFMAKWNSQLPGSGGHIHQSLWDKEGKKNLFYDPESIDGMSKMMEHYIAGQLHCLPEILPMYAPTVNSYKRIGHGDWAPSTVTWGLDNRTAAARVINGSEKATRIELRVPGADLNPYHAIAASLASGLYGIKNELPLPEKTIGNGYQNTAGGILPASLAEATDKMKNSHIARTLLGDDFVDHFIKTREWEVRQFAGQVTDWELKRYFEII